MGPTAGGITGNPFQMSTQDGDGSLPPQGVSELSGGGYTVRGEGTGGRDQIIPDTGIAGLEEKEGDFLGFLPSSHGLPVRSNLEQENVGGGRTSSGHGPQDRDSSRWRNRDRGSHTGHRLRSTRWDRGPENPSSSRNQPHVQDWYRRESPNRESSQKMPEKSKRTRKRDRQRENKQLESGMSRLQVEGTSGTQQTPDVSGKRDRNMLTPDETADGERKAPRRETEETQPTYSGTTAPPSYSQVTKTLVARIVRVSGEKLTGNDKKAVKAGIVNNLSKTKGPAIVITNFTLTVAGYLRVALEADSSLERLKKIVDSLEKDNIKYRLIKPEEVPPTRKYVLWVAADMLPAPHRLVHMLTQCNTEPSLKTLHVRGWKMSGREVSGGFKKQAYTFFVDVEPELEDFLQKRGGRVSVGCGTFTFRPYQNRDQEEGMIEVEQDQEEEEEEDLN